jgi:SAM-dependent methyltransferase
LEGGPAQRDDWDRHWLDYAETTELNPAQRYRRGLIFDLLALEGGQARVLDIGSGQGDFALELLSRYPSAELLGLELSEKGVEIARRKAPAARFLQRDLLDSTEPPPEYSGWATHAVCSEVLEHVDRPQELLANAAAYMAPGCRLVVTVPGGPMSAYDRHTGHRRHFSPAALARLIRDSGLQPLMVTGAGFPFFNLYRLVVILRGERLVSDLSGEQDKAGFFAARAAMAAFRPLFRLNRRSGRRGWQIVAVAEALGGHPTAKAPGQNH